MKLSRANVLGVSLSILVCFNAATSLSEEALPSAADPLFEDALACADQLIPLWRDLKNIWDDPRFKEFGYASAPGQAWLDRVQSLMRASEKRLAGLSDYDRAHATICGKLMPKEARERGVASSPFPYDLVQAGRAAWGRTRYEIKVHEIEAFVKWAEELQARGAITHRDPELSARTPTPR